MMTSWQQLHIQAISMSKYMYNSIEKDSNLLLKKGVEGEKKRRRMIIFK